MIFSPRASCSRRVHSAAKRPSPITVKELISGSVIPYPAARKPKAKSDSGIITFPSRSPKRSSLPASPNRLQTSSNEVRSLKPNTISERIPRRFVSEILRDERPRLPNRTIISSFVDRIIRKAGFNTSCVSGLVFILVSLQLVGG